MFSNILYSIIDGYFVSQLRNCSAINKVKRNYVRRCGNRTRPLGCDSTIVLAVARLSAPATTATHSRVIRLRRVLTDHPPSGSSIDPANVAV